MQGEDVQQAHASRQVLLVQLTQEPGHVVNAPVGLAVREGRAPAVDVSVLHRDRKEGGGKVGLAQQVKT